MAHSVLLVLALAAPRAVDCLPSTGERLPLRRELRVESEGVVLIFDQSRNEAEFRQCDAEGTCVLRIHRVGDDALGEAIELPAELLSETVVLPQCFEIAEIPVEKPRKPTRKRPKPTETPTLERPPEAEPGPMGPYIPGVKEVIGGAVAPAPPSPQGLSVYGRGGTVDQAVQRGWRDSITPGAEIPLDNRVLARIGEDGSLAFEVARARVEGGSVEGEGLNALDGADIAAPMKRTFADATFDARYTLHMGHRRQMVRENLADLRRDLQKIRDDEALSAAEKRARIFALWNAPMDETLPAVNETWDTAAAQARSLIIDFIREPAAFPQGDGGYTMDELERLNRESDNGPFEPYGPRARADAGL